MKLSLKRVRSAGLLTPLRIRMEVRTASYLIICPDERGQDHLSTAVPARANGRTQSCCS